MKIHEIQKDKSQFKKLDFFKLTQGIHRVRFLDEEVYQTAVHFLPSGKFSVKCLGENCPICQRDRKIMLERPDDFKEDPNFIPTQYRYFFNVLDRTNVKVCPNCGAENKQSVFSNEKWVFSATCGCGAFITDVSPTPSNKVKLLSTGSTFGTDLRALSMSVLDDNGDSIGINSFDVGIVVTGTGFNKRSNLQPLTKYMDEVKVNPEDLYPSDSGYITLSPEEILDALRGVSLRDLFTARGNSTPSPVTEEVTAAEKIASEEVKAKIDNLFDQEG